VVERVAVDLCQPLTYQGFEVAFDRIFTSIALSEKLWKNGVNAVGTILPSRVIQPIMTKNDSNLWFDEFAANFGCEPEICRKGIFVWRVKYFGSLPTIMTRIFSRSIESSDIVCSRRSLVQKLF
jgi:hypothetical protein